MVFSPLLRTPVVLAFLLCGLTACGSTQETDTAPADTAAVPTGRWDEADAKNVADGMIGEMLKSRWLQQWRQNHEGRPAVIVGPIEVKTAPPFAEKHIGEASFIANIERKLADSGNAQIVEAQEEREAIRNERLEVVGRLTGVAKTRASLAAEMAQEMGADFLVVGTISSNVAAHQSGGTTRVVYTVNLKLLNVDSNVQAWGREKTIRKIVRRSKGSR